MLERFFTYKNKFMKYANFKTNAYNKKYCSGPDLGFSPYKFQKEVNSVCILSLI